MIWACPGRFPFPLLLLTENHFLGESPFFIMASRLCHQVAASQLFLQLPFTHPAPAIPQTDDPLPDITTWHRLFPQQEIPSHHLPLPVYGPSSLPTYPPFSEPQFDPGILYFSQSPVAQGRLISSSLMVGLIHLSHLAQGIAMVTYWPGEVSSPKLPQSNYNLCLGEWFLFLSLDKSKDIRSLNVFASHLLTMKRNECGE